MTRSAMRLMPRSMLPVIEAIGFDATVCLVQNFGGRVVYISTSPRPTDPLPAVIGLDRAQALARAISPGQFEVPRCVSWLAALKREEVANGRASGLTMAELSQRYGYTQRHLRNLLRDTEPTKG